jgi:hypothetical protein
VHGPLVAEEGGKTYLNKNSKAFKAIRNIVLDQRFLKSLNHYVTFRYNKHACCLLEEWLCCLKTFRCVYHYACVDLRWKCYVKKIMFYSWLCRHTSKLENFNSMLLKYAPKRVGFQ